MIEGKEVIIAGTTYQVPVPNFNQVKKLIECEDRLKVEQDKAKRIDIMAEMAAIWLSRNYPEITKEKMLEDLDRGTFAVLADTISELSGIKKKELTELTENASQ